MIDRTPRDRVGPGQIPGTMWGLFHPSPTRHMRMRQPRKRSWGGRVRLAMNPEVFEWDRSASSTRIIWTLSTRVGVGLSATRIVTRHEQGMEAPASVVAQHLRDTRNLHRRKVETARDKHRSPPCNITVTWLNEEPTNTDYASIAELFGKPGFGIDFQPDPVVSTWEIGHSTEFEFQTTRSKPPASPRKGLSIPSLRPNRWGGFR